MVASITYRVPHSEVYIVNQLRGVEGSIIFKNYGAQWLQEVWKFVFHQPVFKKMTLAGLDSLISLKNLLILMVWSSLAPKWPISVPLCWMDHQKSYFSLISDTLSVGGCWSHSMSFFWKLVDETQISKPPEAPRHHDSLKLLILVPLRADLLYILHYETPCKTMLFNRP